MPTDQRLKRHAGSSLVVVQFLLIAVLLWTGLPSFLSGQAPIGAWVVAILGMVVGLWALSANRPGNFNIRPNPRAGGQLVQQGPYRWIRHPMYTAVMAFGCAAAWASTAGVAWWTYLALVAVLCMKASLEERWMLQSHPAYADYRRRTRYFLPLIA